MADAAIEAPVPTTETTTATELEPATSVEANLKRPGDESDEMGGESKKQKVEEEKSAEEEIVEKMDAVTDPVELGPKRFGSSVEMFDYFWKLIHHWPLNLDLNKYEQMVVLELLNKGHPEPDKKIGKGVKAFQIRTHPQWKSKCFFIIRNDESSEDFSFRKCVDNILPLPEDMQIKHDVNKKLGGRDFRGGKGGRGGGRGRGNFRGGRGRGGKPRN